jgi:hypothetical protein
MRENHGEQGNVTGWRKESKRRRERGKKFDGKAPRRECARRDRWGGKKCV